MEDARKAAGNAPSGARLDPEDDGAHARRAQSHPAREERSLGVDGLDAVCRVLADDGGATRVILESMAEDDVRTILGTPWVHVGSDGVALAPYGPTAGGKPHPRYYGTFARVLGRYVREVKLLSLAEAIHKMTGAPAAALGLVDRGVIREGFAADMVIFDDAAVGDRATFEQPHQYTVGVVDVIVNGKPVLQDAKMTPARPADHALHTHAMKTNLPEGWDYTAVFGLPQTATNNRIPARLADSATGMGRRHQPT